MQKLQSTTGPELSKITRATLQYKDVVVKGKEI
jgi:hypothetical protein